MNTNLIAQKSLSPWEITAEDFPTYGSPAAKWKFFLGYAVLAPSSHNTQPWRFHIRHHRLELFADRTRACPVVDPNDRELIMSCGCALFHLITAMNHFGCFGGVEILPRLGDPDLLAVITLGIQDESAPQENLLFNAMTTRRTNRQPFRDRPVPASIMSALEWAAKNHSAWLHSVSDVETKHAIADLIAEGDRRQWSNPAFRKELAKWLLPNHEPRYDGIPGYAQGLNDLMSCMAPLVVRTFNMGDGQAAKDREVANGSPALVVLGTKGDGPADWIAAGQALANVLLLARAEDVWASFLDQPVEVPELRCELSKLIGTQGFPQAVLRLGFSDDVRPTPRRPIEQVVV